MPVTALLGRKKDFEAMVAYLRTIELPSLAWSVAIESTEPSLYYGNSKKVKITTRSVALPHPSGGTVVVTHWTREAIDFQLQPDTATEGYEAVWSERGTAGTFYAKGGVEGKWRQHHQPNRYEDE